MSADSPFSTELIQRTTEAVGNFLRWVAELIVLSLKNRSYAKWLHKLNNMMFDKNIEF